MCQHRTINFNCIACCVRLHRSSRAVSTSYFERPAGSGSRAALRCPLWLGTPQHLRRGDQRQREPDVVESHRWFWRAHDPPSAIQFDTYLKTKDHRSAKLPEDTTKGTTYTHEIELYPEWLFDEQHDWTRGYKVVDARSGKVLADTAVRIEFPANDWPCATWGHQQARRKDKSAGLCLLFLSEKTRTETGTNF